MRVGFNPHKDLRHDVQYFTHQVIMPIYIPSAEGYFAESIIVLKYCLRSLLNTIHKQTFITLVNNGSCREVRQYLDGLLEQEQIHEVIHTENIGKLNAILKGLAGNKIELVTICDADTLFLPGWQNETARIFSSFAKVGVVGIVPQMKTFRFDCGNVVFDNFFNPKMKFYEVPDPDAIEKFYDSVGWSKDYNHDHTKYTLGLESSDGVKVFLGSGHFAATYRKDIFNEVKTYLGYKLGGDSEAYLDQHPLKKDYWRVTTFNNFAWHMGNVPEDWMKVEIANSSSENIVPVVLAQSRIQMNPIMHFLKNQLFFRFMKVDWMYKIFLSWKKLPKEMIARY